MVLRQTHTYTILEVGGSAYAHIRALLAAADYQHTFHKDSQHEEVIDMHGIALAAKPKNPDYTSLQIECADFLFDTFLLPEQTPEFVKARYEGLTPKAKDLINAGIRRLLALNIFELLLPDKKEEAP